MFLFIAANFHKSDFSFDLRNIAQYFHKISFCGRPLQKIVRKFARNFVRRKTVIPGISFALLLHNTVHVKNISPIGNFHASRFAETMYDLVAVSHQLKS